jgi:hypothetical protein
MGDGPASFAAVKSFFALFDSSNFRDSTGVIVNVKSQSRRSRDFQRVGSIGSMWRFAIESLRGGIGVRLRLSLLAMAAIVPLFALLVAGLITDRHLAIETARTHAMDLARLIAERQADSVQQAKELLSVLRRTPEIAESAASCHAMLKTIAADQSQFNTIGIVRADGLIICNSAIATAR